MEMKLNCTIVMSHVWNWMRWWIVFTNKNFMQPMGWLKMQLGGPNFFSFCEGKEFEISFWILVFHVYSHQILNHSQWPWIFKFSHVPQVIPHSTTLHPISFALNSTLGAKKKYVAKGKGNVVFHMISHWSHILGMLIRCVFFGDGSIKKRPITQKQKKRGKKK